MPGTPISVVGAENSRNRCDASIDITVVEMARFANTADLISVGRGDDRAVIRSVDRDRDRLIGVGPLVVRDTGAEGFGDGLTFA